MLGISAWSQAMRDALVLLLQSSSSLFYGMNIPTEHSAVSGAWPEWDLILQPGWKEENHERN